MSCWFGYFLLVVVNVLLCLWYRKPRIDLENLGQYPLAEMSLECAPSPSLSFLPPTNSQLIASLALDSHFWYATYSLL